MTDEPTKLGTANFRGEPRLMLIQQDSATLVDIGGTHELVEMLARAYNAVQAQAGRLGVDPLDLARVMEQSPKPLEDALRHCGFVEATKAEDTTHAEPNQNHEQLRRRVG